MRNILTSFQGCSLMTSSATACGACGTLNGLARHVSNGRHSASAGIADVWIELTVMKVSYMKLRAQAVVLKEGYSYSTIVWGVAGGQCSAGQSDEA